MSDRSLEKRIEALEREVDDARDADRGERFRKLRVALLGRPDVRRDFDEMTDAERSGDVDRAAALRKVFREKMAALAADAGLKFDPEISGKP